MSRAGPVVERVLVGLAVASLVGAMLLAMLWPWMTTLDQLLAMTNQNLLLWVHNGMRVAVPGWMWRGMIYPLLARPCWLLPVTLGVVFSGAAFSVSSFHRVSNSPRWRE